MTDEEAEHWRERALTAERAMRVIRQQSTDALEDAQRQADEHHPLLIHPITKEHV